MTKDTPTDSQADEWLEKVFRVKHHAESNYVSLQFESRSRKTWIHKADWADLCAAIQAKLAEAEWTARIEQTVHLQVAEQKFGKVDWSAAIYELEPRDKYNAAEHRQALNERSE